jgi:hypothetical protein
MTYKTFEEEEGQLRHEILRLRKAAAAAYQKNNIAAQQRYLSELEVLY